MDDDRIVVLERDVSALKSDLAVLKSACLGRDGINAYDLRLARIEAGIAVLKADVARLLTDVDRLLADMTALKVEVARIAVEQSHMASKLDVKASENRMRTWFIAGFLSLFTLQLAILGVFISSR